MSRNSLNPALMFSSIIAFAFLISPEVQPTTANHFVHLQNESHANAAVIWADWTKDEQRMNWWMNHGWSLQDGIKTSTEELELPPKMNVTAQDFDPLSLNILPLQAKHQSWSIRGNMTLTLFSLDRCEQLYQRFVINNAAAQIIKNH